MTEVEHPGGGAYVTAGSPGRAASSTVWGRVATAEGVALAQGAVVIGRPGTGDEPTVTVGHDSAVLETCDVVGWAERPVAIGRRTVFGHRCAVVGATVGDLCEIGNGSLLLPGAVVGDGCILGEGTLVAADQVVPPGSVLVGRPGRVVRATSDEDRARVAALRAGRIDLHPAPTAAVPPDPVPDPHPHTTADGRGAQPMGQVYEYRGVRPTLDPTAAVADTAELTGDVHVGPGSVIGPGVRIVGDSHGPVRIGARVRIGANSVLHLLPDNELVLDDDVVIGPGSMIHGCRIGAGSIVEPGANVCDWAVLGRRTRVAAGSLVRQRTEAPDGAVLDGFPARVVGSTDDEGGGPDGPLPPPPWSLGPEDLAAMRQVRPTEEDHR